MADKADATDKDNGASKDDQPAEVSSPVTEKKRNKKTTTKKQERVFDWPKKHYLEVKGIDGSEGMKSLLHRLVYIGQLKDDSVDRAGVGSYHDKLFKTLQNQYQTEPITGLLLIYLKHVVHVVETSSDMITEVVRDIRDRQMKEDGFLSSAKILIISHDIPQRLYSQWSYRTLDIQSAQLFNPTEEQGEEQDTTVRLVVDVLTQLLKLGSYVAKQPKIHLKNALDTLYEKVPELLPQQGAVHYLLEENDSCMILPQEYLKAYEKPFDMTLDSELVWPLPTGIFSYNLR